MGFPFASSLCIIAPAQPHVTEVVVYMAPHSAPALPPTAPVPPAPRRGAHRSCPTEREQFLHYCPCPINWNRCCRVYSPLPRSCPSFTAPAQPHATYAGSCIRPCFLYKCRKLNRFFTQSNSIKIEL